jgi:hypothetical protein
MKRHLIAFIKIKMQIQHVIWAKLAWATLDEGPVKIDVP